MLQKRIIILIVSVTYELIDRFIRLPPDLIEIYTDEEGLERVIRIFWKFVCMIRQSFQKLCLGGPAGKNSHSLVTDKRQRGELILEHIKEQSNGVREENPFNNEHRCAELSTRRHSDTRILSSTRYIHCTLPSTAFRIGFSI